MVKTSDKKTVYFGTETMSLTITYMLPTLPFLSSFTSLSPLFLFVCFSSCSDYVQDNMKGQEQTPIPEAGFKLKVPATKWPRPTPSECMSNETGQLSYGSKLKKQPFNWTYKITVNKMETKTLLQRNNLVSTLNILVRKSEGSVPNCKTKAKSEGNK
jgi:hypothetical protein